MAVEQKFTYYFHRRKHAGMKHEQLVNFHDGNSSVRDKGMTSKNHDVTKKNEIVRG